MKYSAHLQWNSSILQFDHFCRFSELSDCWPARAHSVFC